jgi:23S rRNA (cytosine1962-C5)-methyltransferase
VDDYELIDVGGGARLERFGNRLVDRPHPGAYGERADPEAWKNASLFHVPGEGWHGSHATESWTIGVRDLTVELRPIETGQVGIFPEQAPSWDWVEHALGDRTRAGHVPAVLNLFAYTGISTLVAASAGGSVAHVDASKPAIAWARRNAELSGLTDHPVRWLVDDAPAFVARELRRGHAYDGVVLDPPTYGHGARGRAWRLEDDLELLLAGCARLVRDRRGFVLLTAHTPGFGPEELGAALGRSVRVPAARIETGELVLRARSGRHLELGAFARWAGGA